MEEIQGDTHRWKDNLCPVSSHVPHFNLVKISMLLKAMNKFKAISNKVPITLFI
jgi:hypothetical protein